MSGLNAAQRGLDIVGNNIANAATDGYHRQRVNLEPAYSAQNDLLLFGGGVNVANTTRLIDNLLEIEILRQQSSLEQVSQEFSTLRTVENAFGEFSIDEGLSAAIDNFFNALSDLSAAPGDTIWQNQAVSSAESMAAQFRTLGNYLSELENQVESEAEASVEQINALISQIGELNANIERTEVGGARANNLRDRRDQYVNELAGLIGVQTQSRDWGVSDVTAGGIPVVVGSYCTELDLGLDASGDLGITIKGASTYDSDIEGGQLGALLALKNSIIPEIHDDLDSLAASLMTEINKYHVQGVGSEGSFTKLTGRPVTSETLADWGSVVTDGTIYIRVIDTGTDPPTITRNAVAVDVSADSLSDVATAISGITGLTASVQSSKLVIEQSAAKYKFDFIPAVLPSPTASTLTSGAPPTISVSGIYTGTSNDTFNFAVSGAGSVGNGTLQLEVKDNGGAGNVVATLNIGSGYAAGDLIEVGNGIKISVSVGDFLANDNFDVDAFADTDSSGLLAAVGINTFFSGNDASDIAVCSAITASPRRIATAHGAEMTDNANVVRMLGLKDQSLSSLNSQTPGEFYRRLVTDIGQDVSVKQMTKDNYEVITQNLLKQQSDISGVDINEQAAQLLVFEQMFQAMAKYLGTIQSSVDSIMELV